MDHKQELYEIILLIGGKLHLSKSNYIDASFYHKDFSEDEINLLTKTKGIRSLVFYACNIKSEDLKKFGKIEGLETLAFYSCPKITDSIFDFLKDIKKLNNLILVDVPITKEAIEKYKLQFPKINIREPSYNKNS